MKKLWFIILIASFSPSFLFSRVPADTNWREVFKQKWFVQPAPTKVFTNNSGIYISGVWTVSYTDTVNSLAKWDGNDWLPLKDTNNFNGVNGIAGCLIGEDTILYVAGLFDSAGSTPAKNIASWDGSNWHNLGSGINGKINSIAVRNGILYATGSFDSAGNVPARKIAKWDGSSWSALGSGLYGFKDQIGGEYSMGTAIAIGVDGKVYVGGNFDSAGSVRAKSIACWNGSSWSALGSGIEGDSLSRFYSPLVNSIICDSNYIYVGGSFNKVGGDSVKIIARWNGTSWNSLASGFHDGYCTSLCIDGNDLFAGGSFEKADTTTVNNIARWRNETWEPLGSGIGSYGSVNSLSSYNGVLIVVGDFMITGDTVYCPNFGFWSEEPIPEPMFPNASVFSQPVSVMSIVYPNPGRQMIKIIYSTSDNGFDIVSITDNNGIKIKELFSGIQPDGLHELTWDAGNSPSGVYYCRIMHNSHRFIGKIVIEK